MINQIYFMAGREPLAQHQDTKDIEKRISEKAINRQRMNFIKPIAMMISIHLFIIWSALSNGFTAIDGLSAASDFLLYFAIIASVPLSFISTAPSSVPAGIKDSTSIDLMIVDTKYKLSFLSRFFYPLILYAYVIFAFCLALIMESLQ